MKFKGKSTDPDCPESLGVHQSMSCNQNCFDNAMAESLFATIKKEIIHDYRYPTREQAKTALFEYVKVFYNRERLHSPLGYLSPMEYEQKSIKPLST